MLAAEGVLIGSCSRPARELLIHRDIYLDFHTQPPLFTNKIFPRRNRTRFDGPRLKLGPTESHAEVESGKSAALHFELSEGAWLE